MNRNLYKECKDMPNPSKGLLKLFKHNSNYKIWGYVNHNKNSDFVKLNSIKKMSIKELELRIGVPDNNYKPSNSMYVQSNGFTGVGVVGHMFTGRNPKWTWLVGIGTKGKGAWFIDVTDRVIEALNTIGACAISEAHCEFELISPNVKQCIYCKRKIYKKVVVRKIIVWRGK